MSSVPLATKLVLTAAALLGGLSVLLIIEFGLSAGQVHHGVAVSGFEVGGMTLNEVESSLRKRALTLREEPVCLVGDDLSLCVTPAELRWRVEPNVTARRAYQIGRTDFPLGALGERATAWVDGVNVKWEGGPNPAKVGKLLDEWEAIFSERGMELLRGPTRYKIRRAILVYPRRTFRIPLR